MLVAAAEALGDRHVFFRSLLASVLMDSCALLTRFSHATAGAAALARAIGNALQIMSGKETARADLD